MRLDTLAWTERVIERYRGSYLDVLLASAISLLLFLLIALQAWLWFLTPLRLLLALIFVLYIPGYWLTAALFPSIDDLNSLERTGVSMGLSIAWVSVLALILDRFAGGLHLWPIFLAEYAATFLCMGIALWRRVRLPVDEVYTPDFSWRSRGWWRSLPPPQKRLYKVALAALLAVALSVVWVLVVPSPAEFMTEFYMLGEGGMAEEYPREAVVGQDLRVTLGVTNHERSSHTYRVEVWVEDSWDPARREQVAQAGPVTLAPGEFREWPATWQMPWPGQDQKVGFLLFTEDGAEPYRRLRLFLNVGP